MQILKNGTPLHTIDDWRAHGQRTSAISRIEQLAAALLRPPRRGVPPRDAPC